MCGDQEAVDIIKDLKDPQDASRALLDHALQCVAPPPLSDAQQLTPAPRTTTSRNFSSDNLSVLVVSLRPEAHGEAARAQAAE